MKYLKHCSTVSLKFKKFKIDESVYIIENFKEFLKSFVSIGLQADVIHTFNLGSNDITTPIPKVSVKFKKLIGGTLGRIIIPCVCVLFNMNIGTDSINP